VRRLQHQQDMINLDTGRLNREIQNTDYYLNKVQPIAQFT